MLIKYIQYNLYSLDNYRYIYFPEIQHSSIEAVKEDNGILSDLFKRWSISCYYLT